MNHLRWLLFSAILFSTTIVAAQCANDHREEKNGGVLITDFAISGTQAISATELARITSDFIGSCYEENSEEMEERVRAAFQERGYFQAEIKNLKFKPRDPLAVPKSAMLEAEVSEGPQYRLGELTFLKNHAFSELELRQQFPIKARDLVARDKIAMGLESLRKFYDARGYLDFLAIPATEFASNGTMNLRITMEEGSQYHMGKFEVVGDNEVAARLRAEWGLAEGDVYDPSYINQYVYAVHGLLPPSFDMERIQNCPEAKVELRLVLDASQDESWVRVKNVPCEEHVKRSE